MELKVKDNCPLNGFEPCKQLDCGWFVKMRGTDPNTGKEVDEHSCAVAWLPLLLVENALHTRHTGAAVESFRNEMVKANTTSQNLLKVAAEMNTGVKLIDIKDV
jgi:hypothetical protein